MRFSSPRSLQGLLQLSSIDSTLESGMAEKMATLVCKVTPQASKSECHGWTMDEKGRRVLLVKLAAPPVDGKANKELIRFLASYAGCSKSEVILSRGATSRLKQVTLPAECLSIFDQVR